MTAPSLTNPSINNSDTADVTKLVQNDTDLLNAITDGTKDLTANQLTLTDKVLVGNGAVGTPSVTFTNDSDCGLYRVSANVLGIATNGTLAASISADQQLSLPLQSFVRASGSTTAASSGAYTKVVFANEDVDIQSEWASSVFTAKETGVYLATWTISTENTAFTDGDAFWAVLSYNNLETAGNIWAGNAVYPTNTQHASSSGSAIVALTATDTLRIKAYISHTGGATIDNDRALTHVSIYKVG